MRFGLCRWPCRIADWQLASHKPQLWKLVHQSSRKVAGIGRLTKRHEKLPQLLAGTLDGLDAWLFGALAQRFTLRATIQV
jgi:hypothetical protein